MLYHQKTCHSDWSATKCNHPEQKPGCILQESTHTLSPSPWHGTYPVYLQADLQNPWRLSYIKLLSMLHCCLFLRPHQHFFSRMLQFPFQSQCICCWMTSFCLVEILLRQRANQCCARKPVAWCFQSNGGRAHLKAVVFSLGKKNRRWMWPSNQTSFAHGPRPPGANDGCRLPFFHTCINTVFLLTAYMALEMIFSSTGIWKVRRVKGCRKEKKLLLQ